MDKSNIKIDENRITNIKKEENMNIGVIGIPHTGVFPWQTTMSLLRLKLPPNTIVKYHLVGSCLIYDARDKIINFAEKENADWVLFIDSDMVIPDDTLYKFCNAKLDNNYLDLMSGICFKRTPPFQPCFYTKVRMDIKTKKPLMESPIEFPNEGFIECEGFGMACTFIRKSAWIKIKEKHNNELFFPYPGIGEDLSFCIRARMAGIKMYTDLSLSCGHVGNIEIRKEHFFHARDEHFKNKPDEPLFTEVL